MEASGMMWQNFVPVNFSAKSMMCSCPTSAFGATSEAGLSLLKNFETALVEAGFSEQFEPSVFPSSARINLSLKCFDEILPHFGVFIPVMSKIREELLRAIYSSNVTADDTTDSSFCLQTGSMKLGVIKHVPYFVLANTLFDESNKKAEEVTVKLDETVTCLNETKKSLHEKSEELEGARFSCQSLQTRVTDLERHVSSLEKQLSTQMTKMSEMCDQYKDAEADLSSEIKILTADLVMARKEIDELTKYKDNFLRLERSFTLKMSERLLSSSRPLSKSARASTVSGVSPRPRDVTPGTTEYDLSHLNGMKQLESQILEIQNKFLDNFDEYAETHKRDLSVRPVLNAVQSDELENIQQAQMRLLDERLAEKQGQLSKTIDQINKELDLVRLHASHLEQESSKSNIENKQPQLPEERLKVSFTDDKDKNKSPAEVGTNYPDEPDYETNQNPFVPHEGLLSKYACMLYSSDNGRHFFPLNNTKYCSSCRETVFICPHTYVDAEIMIKLPPDTTHLRINRPVVSIRSSGDTLVGQQSSPEITFATTAEASRSPSKHVSFVLDDATSEAGDKMAHTAESDSDSKSADIVHSDSQMSDLNSYSGSMDRNLTPPSTTGSSGRRSPLLVDSSGRPFDYLQPLWDDYRRRTNLVRLVGRQQSMGRVFSFVEQFCAFLVFKMENSDILEIRSTLDKMYDFMFDRYDQKDAAFLTAHDFLTGVLEYSQIDQEDDLEVVQMTYSAFSSNKISPKLVWQFILNSIMRGRELRFQEMEQKILSLYTQQTQPGFITESEFAAVIEIILPFTPENLWRYFFIQAHVDYTYIEKLSEDTSPQAMEIKSQKTLLIPVSRAVHVLSYLELLQMSAHYKSTLTTQQQNSTGESKQNISDKEKSSSDSLKTTHSVSSVRLAENDEENMRYGMIGMQTFRMFAKNLQRFSVVKQDRLFAEKESQFYQQNPFQSGDNDVHSD